MTPEEALETARDMKALIVADAERDDELAPSLVVVRAGHAVARVMLHGDTVDYVAAAAVAVPAFGADLAMIITDGYVATEKGLRERDPKPGEMARLWAKGRTDLVTECLTICWANREGEAWATAVPYVVDGRNLEWGEPWPLVGGKDLGGIVPDGLRRVLGQVGETDLEAALELLGVPQMLGLTPEEGRAHCDAAAVKWLARHGLATMVFGYDDVSARVLKDSFESWEGEAEVFLPEEDS